MLVPTAGASSEGVVAGGLVFPLPVKPRSRSSAVPERSFETSTWFARIRAIGYRGILTSITITACLFVWGRFGPHGHSYLIFAAALFFPTTMVAGIEAWYAAYQRPDRSWLHVTLVMLCVGAVAWIVAMLGCVVAEFTGRSIGARLGFVNWWADIAVSPNKSHAWNYAFHNTSELLSREFTKIAVVYSAVALPMAVSCCCRLRKLSLFTETISTSVFGVGSTTIVTHLLLIHDTSEATLAFRLAWTVSLVIPLVSVTAQHAESCLLNLSLHRWSILLAMVTAVGLASVPWLRSESDTIHMFATIVIIATALTVIVPRLYHFLYLPLTVILLLCTVLARGLELNLMSGPMQIDDTPLVGLMYAMPLTLVTVAIVLGVIQWRLKE